MIGKSSDIASVQERAAILAVAPAMPATYVDQPTVMARLRRQPDRRSPREQDLLPGRRPGCLVYRYREGSLRHPRYRDALHHCQRPAIYRELDGRRVPEPVAAFALAAMASTVASGKNRPATWRGSCAATDDNRGLPSGQLSRRNSRNRSAEGQRGRVKGRGAASRRHFFSARSMRAVSDVS
jgi:hypothetical protein